MPPPKEPCNCPDCKGALMSYKTIERHAAKMKTTIQTFDEWIASKSDVLLVAGAEDQGGSDGVARRDGHEGDSQGSHAKRRRIGDLQPEPPEIRGLDNDGTFEGDTAMGRSRDARDGQFNSGFQSQAGSQQGPGHFLDRRTSSPEPDAQNLPHSDGDVDEEDEGDLNLPDENAEETQEEAQNALEAEAARVRANLLRPPDRDAQAHDDDVPQYSRIEHVRFTQEFIAEISSATLDNGKLDELTLEHLRHPEEGHVDISDPDTRLSLDLFMACNNASEETYNSVRQSVLTRFPGTGILSYHLVKNLVANISGVCAVPDDMCVNSCHAFTGPFADLESCRTCQEPRYDPIEFAQSGRKSPRQQACTIPLGPQIQALRRSVGGATEMRYRDAKTNEVIAAFNAAQSPDDLVYDDIFCGNDYLDLAERLSLTEDDTTVIFSLDGAQLYQNKKSDTWIAIWIVMDYNPTTRYRKKHCLPALIIPGPNKPKNLDSYLFRSFHHLSALQHENDGAGLHVWDAVKEDVILSRIVFLLGTADALGLTEIDGRVGHHGAQGCRIGCNMKGRHKPNSGHYFAAHLCPNDSNLNDSNHPDFDFRGPEVGAARDTPEDYQEKLAKLAASQDQNDYERIRKLTGLSKPSILCGLVPSLTLKVPRCFSIDLMHLLFINLGDLLIPLWRGTMKCETTDDKATWDWATLTGNKWIEHGKLVAAATPYFPSSFHRPPRNPAEKISSGYKATEWFLYIFGLGVGLFRIVLPQKYWRHFCKLVHGVRAIIQRRITGKQLRGAHLFLSQYVEEFELLYYQRRTDRLHYCRPSLHTLLHTCPETHRIGPGGYITQFTLERAIGDLGQSIRQPAAPFANLCQIALRQSQINALKTICPSLDKDATPRLPRLAHDLGNGFILLRPRTRYAKSLEGQERVAVVAATAQSTLRKWGRIRLPNGQVARSLFSELRRKAKNKRNSRNVKLKLNNKTEYAEVQFYFLVENAQGELDAHALVSIYGPPDADILEASYHTLWACTYSGGNNLMVIPTSSISSVISMQPLPRKEGDPENLWFVLEKSGLDDIELTGYADNMY